MLDIKFKVVPLMQFTNLVLHDLFRFQISGNVHLYSFICCYLTYCSCEQLNNTTRANVWGILLEFDVSVLCTNASIMVVDDMINFLFIETTCFFNLKYQFTWHNKIRFKPV